MDRIGETGKSDSIKRIPDATAVRVSAADGTSCLNHCMATTWAESYGSLLRHSGLRVAQIVRNKGSRDGNYCRSYNTGIFCLSPTKGKVITRR